MQEHQYLCSCCGRSGTHGLYTRTCEARADFHKQCHRSLQLGRPPYADDQSRQRWSRESREGGCLLSQLSCGPHRLCWDGAPRYKWSRPTIVLNKRREQSHWLLEVRELCKRMMISGAIQKTHQTALTFHRQSFLRFPFRAAPHRTCHRRNECCQETERDLFAMAGATLRAQKICYRPFLVRRSGTLQKEKAESVQLYQNGGKRQTL